MIRFWLLNTEFRVHVLTFIAAILAVILGIGNELPCIAIAVGFHELMHLIVGSLFNARPCNFTILPRRNLAGDYVMGSVGFQNIAFYNAVPAALAPLLLLPIGFYLNRYFLPMMQPTLFNYVMYVLLQTIIVENAIPSRTDFNVAGKYFVGVVLYIVLGAAILLVL